MGLEYARREELRACLEHLLDDAGNATLMTAEVKTTLCEHALGNYRDPRSSHHPASETIRAASLTIHRGTHEQHARELLGA